MTDATENQAPEGAQLPNVAKTAPAKIHLVIGAGCPPEADFTDCDEVTWCKDKVDANSITYIRADLAAQPLTPLGADVEQMLDAAEAQPAPAEAHGTEREERLWELFDKPAAT